MEFVNWVENSALGIWMIDSLWAYPLILSAHAVGMSIVVGTIVMIDLRLLGFAGGVALEAFRGIFAVTWIGVALNLLSGVALFSADPMKFFYHPLFWTKISLMLMGVVMAFLTWKQVRHETDSGGTGAVSSGRIRLFAGASLLLWFGVIVAGRLIAYVELG